MLVFVFKFFLKFFYCFQPDSSLCLLSFLRMHIFMGINIIMWNANFTHVDMMTTHEPWTQNAKNKNLFKTKWTKFVPEKFIVAFYNAKRQISQIVEWFITYSQLTLTAGNYKAFVFLMALITNKDNKFPNVFFGKYHMWYLNKIFHLKIYIFF